MPGNASPPIAPREGKASADEARRSTVERVQLLCADPDLADGIHGEDRERAERAVVAEVLRPEHGRWAPELRGHEGSSAVALLVLSGMLVRETLLANRRSAELFGGGDVIRPRTGAHGLLPHEFAWTVLEPAAVAVLDDRFVLAARRWPSLGGTIAERLVEQDERLAVHLAIAQLPRVEQRVLGMLWLLADRWGRVTPQGVLVPVRLTHEALGNLVGARRPTVTLALADLQETGNVRRDGEGWVLDPRSRNALGSLTPVRRTNGGELIAVGAQLSMARAAPS